MRGLKDNISYDLYLDFCNFYIKNLLKIVNILSLKKRHLILVPSITAIDELPLRMIEYAASRGSLEMIAKGLHKIIPNVKIITPRFQRIKTIQTISIINKGISSQKAAQELTNIIYENLDFLVDRKNNL